MYTPPPAMPPSAPVRTNNAPAMRTAADDGTTTATATATAAGSTSTEISSASASAAAPDVRHGGGPASPTTTHEPEFVLQPADLKPRRAHFNPPVRPIKKEHIPPTTTTTWQYNKPKVGG